MNCRTPSPGQKSTRSISQAGTRWSWPCGPPAGNVKLLLSANPSHPRAHLTQISRENPDKPPMFCMLLRKHLSGARLLELVQPPMERVVDLRLEALDELGDRVERRLVLEAMGRHSNLILLDGEGRIMDCLRRVDSDMSARRQVLPGLFYRLPPAQEKLDPSSLDRAALESALAAAPEESQADKWLLDTFGGLSPLICRELAFRAGGATDARLHQMGEGGRSRLLDELEGLLRSVQENSFTPVMLEKEGHPSDFTFQPISQYGPAVSCVPFPSFSALLDRLLRAAGEPGAGAPAGPGPDPLRDTPGTAPPARSAFRSRSWPPPGTGSGCASSGTS